MGSYSCLETLILINTDGQDLDQELPFSEANAEVLVSQSTEFDTWLIGSL